MKRLLNSMGFWKRARLGVTGRGGQRLDKWGRKQGGFVRETLFPNGEKKLLVQVV